MGGAIGVATLLLGLLTLATAFKCPKQRTSPGREIICYTFESDAQNVGDSICRCTTLVHQAHNVQNLSTSDFRSMRDALKEANPALQFAISVNDPNGTLKTSATGRQQAVARISAILKEIDAVELNVTAGSKERLLHFVKSLKDEMIRKSSDKRIFLSLPTRPEDLAKQFDLKELTKYVDLFTVATDYLVNEDEIYRTFHPSRLMGLFDMLNADSLVDLISGLGAPKRKLLISLPAAAYKFVLQDAEENAPRSPTRDEYPTVIDRKELCDAIEEGEWTIERDEDLTAPYAFKNTSWIAFEDKISAGIKGKYVMLRDLAGLGVKQVEKDSKTNCGKPLTHEIHHSFTDFKRKSREAVLTSLEDDIHQAQIDYSSKTKSSDFRVVRVVDTEGHIRVVRENTQTEFTCRRQGYFVHPKSCNRFYRCVKFNQEVEDYSVFEFDCPAGLSFDERTEVCVWPGSMPEGSPCPGSSEIAPVTEVRFQCPQQPGYYVDPQNCRWFFACIDLGGPELMAFEFRCPYDLVFDQEKLVCEWPWLVPSCSGSGSGYTQSGYDGHVGGSSTLGVGGYVTGGIPAGFSGATVSGYTGSTSRGYGGYSDSGHTTLNAGYGTTRGSGLSAGSVGHAGSIGGTQYPGSIGGEYRGSTGRGYSGSQSGSDGSTYSQGAGDHEGSTNGIRFGTGTKYAGSGDAGYQGSSAGGYSGSQYTGTTRNIYAGSGATGYQGSSTGIYSGSEYSGTTKNQYTGSGATGYQGSSTGIHAGSEYSGTTRNKYTGSDATGYQGSSTGIHSGSKYSGTTRNQYTGSEGTGYQGSSTGIRAGSEYSGTTRNQYTGSEGTGYQGSSTGIHAGSEYSGTTRNQYTGSEGTGYQGSSTGIHAGSEYSGSTRNQYTGTGATGYRGSSTGIHAGSEYSGSTGGKYAGSDATGYQGSSTGIHAGSEYSGSTGGKYAGSDATGYQGSTTGIYTGTKYSGTTRNKYTGSDATGYQGSSTGVYTGSEYSGSSNDLPDYKGSTGFSEDLGLTQSGTRITDNSGTDYTGIKQGTYSGHAQGSTDSDLSFGTRYVGTGGIKNSGGPSNVYTGVTSTQTGGSPKPGISHGFDYGSTTRYTPAGRTKVFDISGPEYTIPVNIVPEPAPVYPVTSGQEYSSDTYASSGTGDSGSSHATSSVFTNYNNQDNTYVTNHGISLRPGQFGSKTTYSGATGSTDGYPTNGVKFSTGKNVVTSGTTSGFDSSGFTGYTNTGSTGRNNLNITLHLGGTSAPGSTVYKQPVYSTGYNTGIGSTGTIITGDSTQGSIITGDSSSGTLFTQGDVSGTVLTGPAREGTIVTDISEPGYVHTGSSTPGYTISGGVKTVYTESASPGASIHGSTVSEITLGGTPTSGVIIQGQSSPGIVLTGKTSSGVTVGGAVQGGTIVGDTIGTHYYTDSGSTAYNRGNIGVTRPTGQNTGYQRNEYYDNADGTTVKVNNGYVSTEYAEKDLPDYRTSSGISPDLVLPGGRIEVSTGIPSGTIDGVQGQSTSAGGTGSAGFSSTQSVFNKGGFTKTGPTRTGIATATLGGRGSYAVSTGERRPSNSENIGAKAFEGNVVGYTSSSWTTRPGQYQTNVITSTEAPGVSHIDSSKINLGPTVSRGQYYPISDGISSTLAPISSTIGVPQFTGTTSTPYLDVQVYNTPKVSDQDFVTVTPSAENTYTYVKPSYGRVPSDGPKKVTPAATPTLYTTGPLENYKTTLFEGAKTPISISTVQPVIDNGYKTVISPTVIPVAVTDDDRFVYNNNRFSTASLSTKARQQSNLEVGISFQPTAFNQTDRVSVTTELPSVSISSGYSQTKSRGPVYRPPSVTSQPETQYLPSSTVAPVSDDTSGYVYTKPKDTFGQNVVSSTVTYQQPTRTQVPEVQYFPSSTLAPAVGVTYRKPFPASGIVYKQSTPASISNNYSKTDDSSYVDENYSTQTKTTFGSSVAAGSSPANVDISRHEITKLVSNYDRGTMRYTPSTYDSFDTSGFKDTTVPTYNFGSSRKQSPSFFTVTQSTPVITTYSGGYNKYNKSPSVTASYEVTTKSEDEQKRGKVIVKWSDLHPLLLGKLGAECTCRADPFANLRGPVRKLIDSSRGKVDLANYDESEIYVDLEKDGEYDYVTHYGSSTSKPLKIDVHETPAKRPSTLYLPGASSTPSSIAPHQEGLGPRAGKNLNDLDRSTDSGEASFEVLEGANDCARPGLFRHPNFCNKFYACHWDQWKNKFTLHVFNCPVHLTFDSAASACNWPSKGPACQDNSLLV